MWLLSRRTTRFLSQVKKPTIFSRSLPFYVQNVRQYCDMHPDGEGDVEGEFDKLIPKKADGTVSAKFAADTAETNADTKKLLSLLVEQEKSTPEMYEKIFSTICETEEFYLVPKIFQKQLSDPTGPQPSLSHMEMIIARLSELGLKDQIDNILLSFSLYGWIITSDIYGTIIAGFLDREDLETALHYYKLARNFDQLSFEIFELFIDALPAFGTEEAYGLFKKEIVNFRDVKHYKLDISFYEELLGFAITLNKTEDALKIHDYLLENYLTWDESLTNGVLLLLYNSTNIFNDIADPLKKLFFRCIARGVRISDEIFNIILRYFASQNDIMSVYNTYKIADRDSYYLYPESFVPVIRAILTSATPDLLKDLIKVLMYSYIKEEQRLEFVKQMVWRTVNKNDPVSYAKQLDEIYEILFKNEEYSIALRKVMVDYYLSTGDVDKAVSLFLRSVDQVEIKLLNHQIFTDISDMNPLVAKTSKFYSKNPVINKFLKDNIERINLTHIPDVNYDISLVQQLEGVRAPKSSPQNASKTAAQVNQASYELIQESKTPLKKVEGYVDVKKPVNMSQVLSNATFAAVRESLGDDESNLEEKEEVNDSANEEEEDDADDNATAFEKSLFGYSGPDSGSDQSANASENSDASDARDESESEEVEDSEMDEEAEPAPRKNYRDLDLEDDMDNVEDEEVENSEDEDEEYGSEHEEIGSEEEEELREAEEFLQLKQQQLEASALNVRETLKVVNENYSSIVITPEPLSNFGQVRARLIPDDLSLPPMSGEYFYLKRYAEKFNLLLPKFNITDPLKYKEAPEYLNLLSMWRAIAQFTLANYGPLRTLDLFKQIAIRAPMEFFDKQLFDSLITELVNKHEFSAKQIVDVYNDLAQVPSYDTVKILCDKLLQEKDFIAAEDAANRFLTIQSTESPLGRGLRYNIYESIVKEILDHNFLPNPASFVNSYNYFGKSLNPKYFNDAFHRFCAAGKYEQAVFIAVAAKQQRDDESFLRKILLVLPKQHENELLIENSVNQILSSRN